MAEDDRRVAFAIPVTSSDPDKKDDQEKDEDGHGVDPDKKLKDLEQRGEDAIKAAKDQLQKDTQDDLVRISLSLSHTSTHSLKLPLSF